MVGVADVLPKLIAYRLLEPALHLSTPVQIICREGKLERLLAELVVYELDVVLSDAPSGALTASAPSIISLANAVYRFSAPPS